MANITGANDLAARAAIKAKIESLNLKMKVFTSPQVIGSKQDFVEKLSEKVEKDKEIRFCEISYLNFSDDPVEGCDDEPVANITYGLHVFFQFVRKRENGSNSDIEFADAIFKIRNLFLKDREPFAGGKAEPATQESFAQLGKDELVDCDGHSVDLNLEWSFYNGAI